MGAIRFLGLACVVVLAACSAAGTSPSPSPLPSPSPGADFTIDVIPPEDPPEVRMAIPGQKVCFLVVVNTADTSTPVTISATATKAKVTLIQPAELAVGVVGEVWVVPDASSSEATASVTITGTRGGVTKTVERSLPIFPMEDERAADAQPYFEYWVAWLAAEHPELGITADTTWDPTFVSTLLVVSHYAYWSEDWELTIAWHVMMPPDDWSEIHLRHRGTESAPSLAFRMDSWTNKTEPHAVTPPEVVVR
jgi:hypothetical protein